MNEHSLEIIDELFKRVGFEDGYNYDFVQQHKDDWFMQRTWSAQDQMDYQKWLVNYLRKKLKYNVGRAEREASAVILNWGWKVDI
jgi:hypothetical protein